ncbi:MAG TPA: hypothetical protein VJT72_21135 [Pseudonocardiaceae bacterium]|nr:hypothetical protein [Pseudonocardiaceae bacterium]
MTRRARPGLSRALRYGAGTSTLVLVVCALIAGLSAWTLSTVGHQLAEASARSFGEIVRAEGRTVDVRWSAPGVHRTDTVALAVPAPSVGTRTEVAYDPREPATVFVPGSAKLAAVDQAASGVAFSGLIAAIVLITFGWQVISRCRLRRRPGQPLQVRRVRVQSGLLTRSWLELESPLPGSTARWVPVHFDPILAMLPAPTTVALHGDPRHRGLAAAEVDGVWLEPSGPIRAAEPRGRRSDSPAHPDPDTLADTGWRRQLRADAALLTPAPIVGLLWVFLDGGGPLTWACTTTLTATLALWWAALRGSDPT